MKPPRARCAGFTLVEVLVALVILAVIAAMGWQGIDSMARTREIAQASAERSLRLATIVSQLEQDLQAVENTTTAPALTFDGATLRMTRRTEGGLQVVAWALREGRWQRWGGPVATHVSELQESWLASQQLQGQEKAQVELIDQVAGWQVYFYRGGWSNAQSSGDLTGPAEAAPAPTPTPPAAPAAGSPPVREQLPTGVRVVLELPEGRLTRDVALGPQS